MFQDLTAHKQHRFFIFETMSRLFSSHRVSKAKISHQNGVIVAFPQILNQSPESKIALGKYRVRGQNFSAAREVSLASPIS